MRRLRAWLLRFGSLFGRKRGEMELTAEIESHVQMHIEDNVRRGMTHEQARKEALMKLGGIEQTKELYRERRGLPLLQTFWRDVRFGLRMLARNPGFTVVAVLTLALAFVANGVIFGFVDAILLRPLPVRDSAGLVRILTSTNARRGQGAYGNSSYPDFVDLQKESASFSGLAVYERRGAVLVTDEERALLAANIVSANYFSLLGVRAYLGRLFSEQDFRATDAPRVVVLSYRIWQRRFGGDIQIAGKQIRLSNGLFTVAGVTPKEFRGLDAWFYPDLWAPAAIWSGSREEIGDRGDRSQEIIGYLRPGVGLAQARAELDTFAQQLSRAYPKTNADRMFTAELETKMRRQGMTGLLGVMLLAVAGMILLIASANVAGLLLARAQRRHKEMAVRLALGAGRARLVRQLLTEGFLLAALGAAAASLGTIWVLNLVPRLMPSMEIPFGYDFRFDARVLTFTLGMSLLAVFLFALTPALRASRVDLVEDLKEQATPVSRPMRLPLRDVLVVGQLAVSLMLLVVAGLLVRTTWKAQEMDPGFDKNQDMLLLDIAPGLWGYDDTHTRQLYSQILPRIEALPGVRRASLVQRVPLSPSGGGATRNIFIPGMDLPASENGVPIHYTITGAHYFETMGTRILRGRPFTEQDAPSSPGVVIINETMARRFWPGQEPIGRHFRVGGRQGRDCEIIAVVQDGKYNNITEAPDTYLYFPLSQEMTYDLTLLVKTANDSRALLPAVRQELRAVDKNISVMTPMTLAEHMRFATYTQRATAVLVGSLGLLGLFLAAVGLYGVVSYTMSQRTHEIGVRMALGAAQRDIFRLVLGRGLRLALIGVGIGLIAALGLSHFLTGLLYGVSAADPITFVGVAILLVAVSLLACYVPARRATRVEPIMALRYE